jgi:hypothetical protein
MPILEPPLNGDDTNGEQVEDPDLPQQLLRDAAVYEELRAASFGGAPWEAHREETFGYAYQVFHAWATDGSLFERLRRTAGIRGTDRLPSGKRRFSADEVKDLVGYLMLTAIPVYRARLMEGRWRPEGGATLRTYFVRQLSFQLVRRYWRWVESRQPDKIRPERELKPEVDVQSGLHGDVYAWSEPEGAAIAAAELRRMLGGLDPTIKRILAMEASGYRNREIGAAMNMTAKAVEMRLRSFRASAKERRQIA